MRNDAPANTSCARRRDLEDNLKRLVDAGLTWDEVRADFEFLKTECEAAFDVASTEPKVESREEQVSRCAVPYAEPPRHLPPGERESAHFGEILDMRL